MTEDSRHTTLRIVANEDLFNKWKTLGDTVAQLSAIVQNDMEITPEQLSDWVYSVNRAKNELELLLDMTVSSLEGTTKRTY